MGVGGRTVEQKVRSLLAAHGLSQGLFSRARLLEQQQGQGQGLRIVGAAPAARGGVLRFGPVPRARKR